MHAGRRIVAAVDGTVNRRDPGEAAEPPDQAVVFERLFRAIYLMFHRRDPKRSMLSGASRAVLLHLAMSGPLTVTEAARHLDRAQSVVSDIVTQLEAKGLLERERDPADGRRTLVWLTPDGLAGLTRDQEVLSPDLLRRAMAAMPSARRADLLGGAHALLAAADQIRGRPQPPVDPQPPSQPQPEESQP